MAWERRLSYGDRTYVVRLYDNDTVGVFDGEGRLIVGFPASELVLDEAGQAPSDDWSRSVIRRLRLT